jgi:ABC-2 type transport system ATP-binding protein
LLRRRFWSKNVWALKDRDYVKEVPRKMLRAAISIHDLSKTFAAGKVYRLVMKQPPPREGVRALGSLSLDVQPGEALALLGANGAGKTTLLEILSTLLLPTAGSASVYGHDVVREAAGVRRFIGYCPWATDSFYPRLSGAGNLHFFALLHDLTSGQAKARVEELLDLLKVESASANKPFQQCSEGIKQRLALARALLADPSVLLLDEPTKSLDPLFQGEIRRLLREEIIQRRGKTVLLATHSLAEAERVCDRVAILHRGDLRALGSPAEVRRETKAPDLERALQWAVEVAD